jgi:carbonic anhydrase/acetyltransferase-like protein (isoleucine patch superfamily)
MGAVVLQRARVGRRAVIAAGSVVAEDARIPPDVLAAGAPAQVKRELSGRARQWGRTAAGEYQRLFPRYLVEARAVQPASGGSVPPAGGALGWGGTGRVR